MGDDKNYELVFAAIEGDLEKVKFLLHHGADANTKIGGTTALLSAAIDGHNEIVKLLIDASADVNAFRDEDGKTALIFASIRGHNEVVKTLLECGADVLARDNEGFTALISSAIVGNNEVVMTLLTYGADVNAKDNRGDTALYWASFGGYEEVVKSLLKFGTHVDLKFNSGPQSLWTACYNGHFEVVKTLLKYDIEVNAKDSDGSTALMRAAHNGHVQIVTALLEYGADVNARDDEGNTAFVMASHNGHEGVLNILRRHGVGDNENSDGNRRSPSDESTRDDIEAPKTAFDQQGVGFFHEFIFTLRETLLDPTRFFRHLPLRGGYRSPFLYSFTILIISTVTSHFVGEISDSKPAQLPTVFLLAGPVIGSFLFSLIVDTLGIFVMPALMFICLFVLGIRNSSLEAIFRISCYASGPSLLRMLPFYGTIVASMWEFIILVKGLTNALSMGIGKAILAVVGTVLMTLGIFSTFLN